jgi:DNA-binding SARP family transcriptional activator
MQLMLARQACAAAPGRAPIALAPRDAAPLTWLAFEGPTPRTRLAALLWPGSDASAARNTLRQRLFQLRKLVGVALVTGGTTLALADGFEHDLEASDSVLGNMVDEVGGEFAGWLGQQRARRHARVRQAMSELAQMAEDARDWSDALAHAGELLALEPMSEAAHRRVMRLHYLRGDRAAALFAFDRCERMLKDDGRVRAAG